MGAYDNELAVLKASRFGSRTAEEEHEYLHQYFVETEQWRRVFDGEVDVVYGPKGSGKSAIYSLIVRNEDALFDKNVLVVPGENPNGSAAFEVLRGNSPKDEFEFVSLWKFFILTLAGQAMKNYGIDNDQSRTVIKALEDADLLPSSFSLSKAVRYALDYVKRAVSRVESLEGGLAFDPATIIPAVTAKISLREPSAHQANLGEVSIDELLVLANDALKQSGQVIWILLDRLDVAFYNLPELEVEALRALFKYYLDTKHLTNIRPKIFIRTDIWTDIVKTGFREASHIEKSLTIRWRTEDLLNLVVRRLLSNAPIANRYGVSPKQILDDVGTQEDFFYRVFPLQVESGSKKQFTLEWIITRTTDASEEPAPREIIHMLNELRDEQIKRFSLGQTRDLEIGHIFEQAVFKQALPQVSTTRLEQTLYAENSNLKPWIEMLREKKATQNLSSLAAIWGMSEAEALKRASELEAVGFFRAGKSGSTQTWRVPFIYRPALKLVQGSADAVDAA